LTPGVPVLSAFRGDPQFSRQEFIMSFDGVISRFCLVVLLLAPFAATAQKTTNTNTNVTTVIHDYSSDGFTQLLLRSDDNNGSGQATYTTSGSRGASLSSFINSIGEWQLALGSQSVRTVWITPNDPVGTEPAGPPVGYYWDNTTVRSDCFDQNGNVVPLANVVTSSGNCKLGVNFNSGRTTYKLLMSPFPFSGSGDGTPQCPSSGCPATGFVSVTCNSVSNSQCVSWTIVPTTSSPNLNIANLYRMSSSKGSLVWVYIGQYYNTFRIDLMNP
jgi:hypothetical protein